MNNLLKQAIDNNRCLINQGRLADYIPALNNGGIVNHIGISIIDSDGVIYSEGQYSEKFTIQSISKILSFILAVMDNGEEEVFKHVGYEGIDEPFNYFIKLDSNINKPANPMINSGALVTTSLIKGDKDERFIRMLELARNITNNPKLGYNDEVYLSEKKTGDRNRSIAYLMKSKGIIKGNVEDILDTYFKQCSIEGNTIDLAHIGRFISGGCNGIDSDKISNRELCVLVKGILFSCGMYNYSTEYSIKVGVPSKSGVGGGIMGVLPHNMGIGVYSPALDDYGNSIAGIGIMKELSKKLDWNKW